MIGIFMAKIQSLIRTPWTFILMTSMSVLFAFIIGSNSFDKITVPTNVVNDTDMSDIINEIESNSFFKIKESNRNQLIQKVETGKSELGLELMENDFNIIVGIDSPNVHLLEQVIRDAFIKVNQWKEIEKILGEDVKGDHFFQIENASFSTNDEHIYDGNLHSLFGFTLFFVIYTIAFSVFQILEEKKSGVWNRMILSSVRKWEMYAGNFLYSFLVGYLQVVLIFSIFRYIVKVDFYGTFAQTLLILIPYVLAIVALSTFLVGIVKSVQQFSAAVPIMAVSMAMIGGAYWPLEIVESSFMIMLSKIVPITYAMDALQGVTVYGDSIGEVMYPITILLLMSVVLTGLGIHLMERRYIS